MAGQSSIKTRARLLLGDQRGASLIEFAMVFLIFIFLIFGTLEGSLLYFANSSVKRATRDGVRIAAASGGFTWGYPGSAEEQVVTILAISGITEGAPPIKDPKMNAPDVPPGEYRIVVNAYYQKGQRPNRSKPVVKAGRRVEVKVFYRYEMKTGITGGVLGENRLLSAGFIARSEPI